MILRSSILAIGICVILAQSAFAQSVWVGGAGDANWSSLANWEDGLPTSSDETIITLAGTLQNQTLMNLSSPFILNQLLLDPSATNGFSISSGSLQFSGSGAAIFMDSGVAPLQVHSAIHFNSATTLTVTEPTTSEYDLILSGPLSGTGALTITGDGFSNTLIRSSSNLNTGSVTVASGALYTGAVNALDRTARVAIGASGIVSTFTPESVDLSVSPVAYNQMFGRLTSTSANALLQVGDSTNPGTVIVGFDSTSPDYSYAGTILASSNSSSFAKVGTQLMTLTGSSSSFTGDFSVRDGGLILSGNNGRLPNASNITVYGGSNLRLNNAANNNQDRISNSGSVTLAGGLVQLIGNGSANTSEAAGPVVLTSGQSTIEISSNLANGGGAIPSGRAHRLRSAQLISDSSTATLFVRSTNLSSTESITAGSATGGITFETIPTLVGGGGAAGSPSLSVIPFALGANSSDANAPTGFITYQGTGGTAGNNRTRLLTDSEYANTFGTATNNISLDSSTETSTTTVANTLRITSGGSLNNSSNLTLTAGALLNNGGGNITGDGNLIFGNTGGRTAYITSNSDMSISNNILAANLSKNGAGNVTLTNATSLTGTAGSVVAVNAGTMTFGIASSVTTDTPLGSSNTLTYQVSRGANLDVTANGLSIGTHMILTGGASTAADTSLAVNRATVTSGTGSVALVIDNGGTITPSSLSGRITTSGFDTTLSVGTLHINGDLKINGGATYRWTVNSAITNGNNDSVFATPGTLEDFLSPYTASNIAVSGNLDLSGASSSNRINLRLTSLNLAQTEAGAIDGSIYDMLSTTDSRGWVILEAGSINDFSPDKFNIDISDFSIAGSGSLTSTQFELGQVGNKIVLYFNPVPEPATVLACGALGLLATTWLRRRFN